MVRKSRKSREDWKIYNNVFDAFTERKLFDLASKGYFDELVSSIALGKEANIFLAEKRDGTHIIVKIYRLENSNFNKMYDYIRTDPRFDTLENQRRKIIFTWTQREFRNLLIAREKIRVPTPIFFQDNIILMESIGGDQPAPQLKNAFPKNPQDFFKKTTQYVKDLLKAGLVHGDLSDFNILNLDEEPVFIDFGQGTPIKSPNAKELLERDIYNVVKPFERKIKIDKNKTTKEIMKIYDKLIKDEGLKL